MQVCVPPFTQIARTQRDHLLKHLISRQNKRISRRQQSHYAVISDLMADHSRAGLATASHWPLQPIGAAE